MNNLYLTDSGFVQKCFESPDFIWVTPKRFAQNLNPRGIDISEFVGGA